MGCVSLIGLFLAWVCNGFNIECIYIFCRSVLLVLALLSRSFRTRESVIIDRN